MEEKALLKQVIDNPRTFETIKNPSQEVIIAALSRNGNNIKFVMNPTFEQKKTAIKNTPLAIQYIDDLEEELQILAVKLLWNSLKFIKNPSLKVKMAAVKTRGWAIQYIDNPAEELAQVSVKKDYDAIKYIKNPSKAVQLFAIENYFGAIKFIKNPELDIKRAAINIDEEAINYIDNYDENELKIFIRDNINILKYAYGAIEPEIVVEILIDKLKEDEFTKEYMGAFLDLEILEMDKIRFISEYGNKRTKKLLVDYKLSK